MAETKNKSELAKYRGNYIILMMGPTGAGKSTFINMLLGLEIVKVGHRLVSCTTDLQPVEIPAGLVQEHLPLWRPVSLDPLHPAKLIMVDTPGFDDTSADDSETLKRIVDWLAESYGAGAKLAGIIYLQDITQYRVTGATKRTIEVFEKLCGDDACKSVVLGTTKWPKLHRDDVAVAEEREQELGDTFWKAMIKKGSTIQRVDDTSMKASPWNLVATILIQWELPRRHHWYNFWLRKNEVHYIIPVIGPTGSGKSTFINQLLGKELAKVGHSLDSCTLGITSFQIPESLIIQNLHGWDRDKRVVLVDTPGFNNTNVDDITILKGIRKQLVRLSKAGAILASVIYLDDITLCRVTRTVKIIPELLENLQVDGCKTIVLGTTNWSRVAHGDWPTAEERELRLSKSLNIDNCSRMRRVDPDSAWKLVEAALCKAFGKNAPPMQG